MYLSKYLKRINRGVLMLKKVMFLASVFLLLSSTVVFADLVNPPNFSTNAPFYSSSPTSAPFENTIGSLLQFGIAAIVLLVITIALFVIANKFGKKK